jgi:hypothetical protein
VVIACEDPRRPPLNAGFFKRLWDERWAGKGDGYGGYNGKRLTAVTTRTEGREALVELKELEGVPVEYSREAVAP